MLDDDVQQAERERGVGAGERREVLVGLRRGARASGSIATMCAPFLRALRMNFHRWWPLVSVFVPHSRISFECANVSGSIPAAVPVV